MHKKLPEKVLIDPTKDLLTPKDKFRFFCHPGIECFNSCCYDLNLILTPYDVIRLKKDHCMGFDEDKTWIIEELLEDQGAKEYNEMNDLFMEVIAARNRMDRELTEEEIEKIYLACFDIDRFREVNQNVPDDDLEAMKFGIEWVLSLLR